MAKLNGVKTVDMINGEITKVTYEGAEYAKVATGFAQAQSGDLFLSQGQSGETFGAFYEIKIVENSDNHPIRFVDDKGRDNGYMRNAPHLDLFRKISADKPTLEQRVGALESDVAALKGEKESSTILALGERVKTSGISKYGYDCDGMVGVIKENDLENGCYYVKLDSGKGVYLKPTQVKKSEETIEFEGATYRKVEREARKGDVVIFTDKIAYRSFITKNQPYKVLANGKFVDDEGDRMSIYRNDSEQNRTRETVDVYEPIEQTKYVPQEGDIVVITANTNGSRNKVGDIGKIRQTSMTGTKGAWVDVPQRPDSSDAYGNYTELEEFRKATSAEVEKYEQAVKDAEIAEKWAKIGRKPNEFKEGDVLSYKYGSEPICYYKVTRIDGNKVYFDCHEFGNAEEFSWKDGDGIQLVAPVESLFNA